MTSVAAITTATNTNDEDVNNKDPFFKSLSILKQLLKQHQEQGEKLRTRQSHSIHHSTPVRAMAATSNTTTPTSAAMPSRRSAVTRESFAGVAAAAAAAAAAGFDGSDYDSDDDDDNHNNNNDAKPQPQPVARQAGVEDLQSKLEKAEEAAEKERTLRASIEKAFDDLTDHRKILVERLKEMEEFESKKTANSRQIDLERKAWEREREQLKKEIENLKRQQKDKIPESVLAPSQSQRDRSERELAKLRKELQATKMQLAELQRENEEEDANHSGDQEQIQLMEAQMISLREEVDRLHHALKDAKKDSEDSKRILTSLKEHLAKAPAISANNPAHAEEENEEDSKPASAKEQTDADHEDDEDDDEEIQLLKKEVERLQVALKESKQDSQLSKSILETLKKRLYETQPSLCEVSKAGDEDEDSSDGKKIEKKAGPQDKNGSKNDSNTDTKSRSDKDLSDGKALEKKIKELQKQLMDTGKKLEQKQEQVEVLEFKNKTLMERSKKKMSQQFKSVVEEKESEIKALKELLEARKKDLTKTKEKLDDYKKKRSRESQKTNEKVLEEANDNKQGEPSRKKQKQDDVPFGDEAPGVFEDFEPEEAEV